MKKLIIPIAVLISLTACNNSGKDSVDKADSANKANLDTALNNNGTAADENSSEFLVRVANKGMAETQIAQHEEQKGSYADVKSFASMLYKDHTGVNQAVKDLAASKNVVLPDSIANDPKNDLDRIKKLSGRELDKEFVNLMINWHESSISSFEKALSDTKDPDVRAFADKTLPALRSHLETAKALKDKYWK